MNGFSTIRIQPVRLHWLVDDSPGDLCAHAGVVVTVDGEPFITSAEKDLAVSTGALHLLRTLADDHTPQTPRAEHLIPHCGHFMAVDDESGAVVNVGCLSGANWWVRHEGGGVVLTREDGAEARVSEREWARAVAEFADAVDAFYATSPARQPADEHEAEWFPAMRHEWRQRRSAINLSPEEHRNEA
ncbi:hypothetical protein [Longimicrobium terrae]|uniref:Uncharacterized protein n=1 Tax=Longimicrobium terrae TaxID=1639882 RepID=A0A841GZF8_9BACT|nr:hypothetical protein [Longimicrobium terrae]MBB4636858.1 hypothetical protein [Longimicrobium terrae]MBB6071142.1 hypothetical protein [Longimicrobium terrae]NNC29191.1 hypothetical protein [Longimicrobium terrae]